MSANLVCQTFLIETIGATRSYEETPRASEKAVLPKKHKLIRNFGIANLFETETTTQSVFSFI
jgi:hypothetical protein